MKNSVTLKVITITVLMLLLLIPASMIETIIHDRQELHNQTINEVSSKWANSQQIKGPILTIPIIYEYQKDEKTVTTTEYWNILPEQLSITGSIEPKELRRGIYEVVVYTSDLTVSGTFSIGNNLDRSNLKEIRYENAFLTIGLSDLRGVKNQVEMMWGKRRLKVEPGSKIPRLVYSGITVKIPDLRTSSDLPLDFEFALDLQGSKDISFVPLGSKTSVDITSSWTSPSFNGTFLPDSREVNDNGFIAQWNILELNRNFPQSWMGNDHIDQINSAAFGVDLAVPLGDYQKSMRSAKYAVMTIALTFLIFFLVEVLGKLRIHPLQYALVGLALCLFYTLLVSITEHSNFDLAFGISTLGVTSMITFYSISIFHEKKFSLLLMSSLVGIYGFLFVTLQLADYALLMGSLGLSIILASTMYFTRNVNWYNISTSKA